MASSMISTASVVSINRASPAQASMVAPFTGASPFLHSQLPVRKLTLHLLLAMVEEFSACRSGHQLERRNTRFSYLPDLNIEQLAKEIDYFLRSGWVPCLEFELEHGFVYREHHRSPGYYDGRYWTTWKLPMFGCTYSSQVLKEVEECKKEYPNSFIRIIGFDNVRQVQCISFIAAKPPGY